MNPSVKTVDEYLKQIPAKERAVLKKIRKTILEAVPDAQEKISYQMPGYMYHGHLVFFAMQKNYCSLYALGRTVLKQFEKELKSFEVKGLTIHFTAEHPLPLALIKRMVKARAKQNEEKKKKPAKKKAK